MSTRVAIVIPTHNRCELLKETIESIRGQTFESWVTVVVDDHSDDDTQTMVATYENQDRRIQYYRLCDTLKGANAARNAGIQSTESEYVVFLDSDDLLAPNCLSNRMIEIEKSPDLGFIVSQGAFFDSPFTSANQIEHVQLGGKFHQNVLDGFLSFSDPWQITGPLWRRSVLSEIGPWNENLGYYQDWELSLRAIVNGVPFRQLDVIDYYIRRHDMPSIRTTRQRPVRHTTALLDAIASLGTTCKNSTQVRKWMSCVSLNLSRRHAFVGDLKGALASWRHCRDSGYISRHAWLAALPLIAASRVGRFQGLGQQFLHVAAPECLAKSR